MDSGEGELTEHRGQAEALLIYKLLFDHARDPILLMHRDGRVVEANEAAVSAYGYTREEFLSLTVLDLRSKESRDVAREQMARADERGILFEAVHRRKDGSEFDVEVSSRGVDIAGKRYLLSTIRDITQRRALERSREEYVSLISHDLRAPVTVVQGNAQILHHVADQPDKVRRTAESIYTAARRMNRMIQDLVDSARLESGQLRLERIPIDLASFIIDLKTRLTPLMDSGRVKIDVQEVVPPALADPDGLERILTNLLSNALKYSEGEVEVALVSRGGEVEVAVTDRGPGVSTDEAKQLFTRHYRTRSAQKKEGLGLGLYITRLLVEAHGGRIWAECEPGKGCAFRFTIPAD